MSSGSGNSRTRGGGRYKSTPDYTPILGVRLYARESGFVLSFFLIAAYFFVRLHMSITEISDSSSLSSLLGIAGVILLAAGAVLVFFTSLIKELPGIFLFTGLLLMLFSMLLFGGYVFILLISETGIIGVLQGFFELLFLFGTAIVLCALLLACLNRKIKPAAGYFAMVVSVLAAAMLLLRTISTFASLSSALGPNFSWDSASGLSAEIRWVLLSVSTDSPSAQQMFYARLFERITLIILILSALPLIFHFPSFFRQYNTQMEIYRGMPGNEPQLNKPELARAFGSGDILTGLAALRGKKRDYADDDEQEDEPLLKSQSDEEEYIGPDYLADDVYPDEQSAPQQKFGRIYLEPDETDDRRSIRYPDSKAENSDASTGRAEKIIYNTDLLDRNYGKPIELTESASEVGSPREKSTAPGTEVPQRNAESGAYKVKLRPSTHGLPDPDDPSIWDNYEL